MTRRVIGALPTIVMLCACAASARAASAPTLSTSLGQSTASIGSTDPLTFTITAGDAAVKDLEVYAWFPFPGGLNVAVSTSSRCGGTLTTTPAPQLIPENPLGPGGGLAGATYEMELSGASVAAGGSCSFSVPLAIQGAGKLTVTSYLTAGGASVDAGVPSTASVTVPAIGSPATVTSAFSPRTVDVKGATSLTVTVTNPNTSTTLTDLRFLMETFFYLPTTPVTDVDMAPEAILGNSCGGSGIFYGFSPANFTIPAVDYGGGSLAPGATCAITVRMSAYSFSTKALPVTVASNEGGASAVSDALLTSVQAPPNRPAHTKPSNRFAYTKPKVAANGRIIITLTLPGKGTVRLRETWRGKLIAHIQKAVTTARKLTITLTPGAATRRRLKSDDAARLKLSLAYTPTGGKTRTITLTERTPR